MRVVEEFHTLEELEPFRPVWRSLWNRTEQAGFFQSLDWLEAYWRHWAGGQRLRVIVVADAGETVGLVPLVVRSVQTRLGTLRFLTYPLDEWGSFFGPVGPEPVITLTAAFEHLCNTQRDWDVLDLRWVSSYGRDAERTRQSLRGAGLPVLERPWQQIPVIEFSGTEQDYWAGRSKNFRSKCRKNRRNTEARGEVRYVRYRPRGAEHGESDPRWDLYGLCEQIAERSWQGASTTGTTLTHGPVRDFLREAHQAACRLGAADIELLFVGDRPAAFNYNYCGGGRIASVRTGFDPDFADCGAGSVLLERSIEDSFTRGDVLLDFGPGSLDYKRRWQTAVVTTNRYSHFATAPRAQLLNFGRWTKQTLSGLGRLPARLKSLAPV